jgi:hypothetical protein
MLAAQARANGMDFAEGSYRDREFSRNYRAALASIQKRSAREG